MNKFRKYCPNVWVAECEEEYKKGDIIQLTTKYNKEVDCEVYNFLFEKDELYYYSIVRIEDKTYAERKAEKYQNCVDNNILKSKDYFEKSLEGREFLSLGEPIKVGHHSEKRHRALIERNNNRLNKSFEFSEKAKEYEPKVKYWEDKAKEITLAMPESLEYFTFKLEEAIQYRDDLKSGKVEQRHSYSKTYAQKDVRELKKKVETAKILWG